MSLQIKWYLDLVCAKQGGRPGSPEQLTEAVLIVLLKKTALECPQPVCIVHLHIKKKKKCEQHEHPNNNNNNKRKVKWESRKGRVLKSVSDVTAQHVPCGSTRRRR